MSRLPGSSFFVSFSGLVITVTTAVLFAPLENSSGRMVPIALAMFGLLLVYPVHDTLYFKEKHPDWPILLHLPHWNVSQLVIQILLGIGAALAFVYLPYNMYTRGSIVLFLVAIAITWFLTFAFFHVFRPKREA